VKTVRILALLSTSSLGCLIFCEVKAKLEMDPISAAGIGLSVASLVLQVFAGCVKGYTLFLEANDVPQSYQHLRTRLRIEQVRLLNWGQSVGLVEELLQHPSQALQFNRNLILDVLLEIQATFKSCVEIGDKYDSFVPQDPTASGNTLGSKPASFLKRTLAVLDKQPRVVARLQWVMVKQSQFEGLVFKLIAYNDQIESLLDRSSLEKLHLTQQHTHMAMLQLAEQVSDLRTLSQAILLKGGKSLAQPELGLSRSSTLVAEPSSEDTLFAGLATFKAQLAVEAKSSNNLLLTYDKLILPEAGVDESQIRVHGSYEGRKVFIEWRESIEDLRPRSQIHDIVQNRVSRLAALLHSPLKPPAFRAPYCIGYFQDVDCAPPRYGLVYDVEKTFILPKGESTAEHTSTTLRALLTTTKPSLNRRISLARSVVSALMYLHSVNWLHKGLRSDSILITLPQQTEILTSRIADLSTPILSGFDFSRPDLPEEVTLQSPSKIEYDLYRHPSLLQLDSKIRAQKSHDIYSLGIILLELAHWKPIERIMGIEMGKKTTRGAVGRIRERLIGETGFRERAEGVAGEVYADVVWRCVEGGWTGKGEVETSAVVGAEMQRVFFEEVWGPLEDLRV
jgi:hypothetical protein